MRFLHESIFQISFHDFPCRKINQKQNLKMEKSRLFKKRTFLLCLPLLLFASCDKGPEGYGPEKDGMLEFDAAVSAVTRSTIDWTDFKCDFEPGDAIGVFAAPHGSPLAASGNYASNVKLVKQADGSWSYADEDQAIFFPAGGVTLDIYAYYPYAEAVPNPLALAFDAGTDQSAGAPDSELMWAKEENVAEAGNQIRLQFGHVFSMLQLEVSPVADSAIDVEKITYMDVKLNGLKSAVSFNIGDGTASLSGDAVRIRMERKSGSRLFRALVPVQDVVAGSILFSCTVGQESGYTQFNYDAAPNTVLASGVVKLYDVKLP